MPLLSYAAITDFPFVPYTKIYSADVNNMFLTIQTLLNTTGLDSTNIQTNGILVNRINISGGTAGQFIGQNGTNTVWVSNPLTTQFNVIIGAAADVVSGLATYSSFAAYTQTAGDRVLVLPTYVTNESISITQPIYIQGLGHTTVIQGAITLNSGSSYTYLRNFQTQNNLTVSSGVTGCEAEAIWFTGTNTFVDNNTTMSNLLTGFQG